jgi:hypothetical protein
MTATAIRLVDLDQFPGFVISHTPRGRKWFARSPSVPRHWFPRDDLDAKSFAFGVQFGGRSDDSAPRKISADAWFDRQGAARFMVREQTFRVSRDEPSALSSSTTRRCSMIAKAGAAMGRGQGSAAPLPDGTLKRRVEHVEKR